MSNSDNLNVCKTRKQIKKFESERIDPYLFKIMTIFAAVLEEVKHIKNFDIEEIRINENFLYFIENNEKNLSGYIGRRRDTGKIVYMIMDRARLNWALKEGFTRDEAFDLVGVYRNVCGLTDFTNFISGEKNYHLCGEYFNKQNVASCNCRDSCLGEVVEKKTKTKKQIKKK